MTEILRGAAIMTATESAIGGASESPVQQRTQSVVGMWYECC
jgi:hypothetical protein